MGVDPSTLKALVEARLSEMVPDTGRPSEAARHSLLAPGKRLRAVLTMLACAHVEGRAEDALDVACAVEMIHTASLIFDDLPAMDDAALRRGRVTSHVAYGDDVAILAGIGLLNGAFEVVATAPGLGDPQRVTISKILARAVGWHGLVGGQARDLSGSGEDLVALEDVHHGKTGVLFVAAALCGAATANKLDASRASLTRYGKGVGLAYQAIDDVIDEVSSSGAAGKTTRRDTNKATAVSLAITPEAVKERIDGHLHAAKMAVGVGPLADLTDEISAYLAKALGEG